MSDNIMCNIHYGTVQPVSVDKIINGEYWLGGYSIYRDRDGVEVKRTKPTFHTRLIWQ